MAKKLWIEEYGAAEWAENHSVNGNNWTDETANAIAWDKYGYRVMDYLFYRDKINTLLFPICNPNYPTVDFSGWGNLTADEQKLMAKYILAPYALRTTIYSDADDKQNWFDLLRITQGTEFKENLYTGRARLIEIMRRHVADKVRIEALTMAQTQDFLEDVDQLLDWYIRAANPKFKLWLYSLAPYDTTGFNSKAYWSQGLEDELIAMYENGE